MLQIKEIIKKLIKSSIFQVGVLILLFSAGATFLSKNEPNIGESQLIGASFPNAQWFNYSEFSGYQTDVDPEKVADGSNPQGQNTTAYETDRIGVRDYGYNNYPESLEATTTVGKIRTLHNFRKRNGENILIRSYGTVLEFFDETQQKWVVFKSGLTNDKKFGFTDYNINTDLTSYTYFGNAYDNFMRWTGSVTHLTSDVEIGTTTINVINATNDFTATSSVMICGHERKLSSRSTTTMTFATSTDFTCDSGQEVIESVEEFPSNPKGNIYINFDNRIFISGVIGREQMVYFSKYGDPSLYATTLVTASIATSPGIFNLGEGGGAVTGMAMDEESLYLLKRSIIYKVGLTDVSYSILPLKTFDGKSQTVGATNANSIFAGGNGVFLTTPDNQILFLERVAQIDYPQLTPISSVIKNSITNADFSESSGIVYRDKAYFSFKSSSDAEMNDTVFVYNIKEKTWDSPVVGWTVQDWAVYNDGISEKLFFSSSASYNVNIITENPSDGGFDVKSNWRSKKYNFGSATELKELKEVYIDGYISENTTLKISAIGDDGSQVISTELKGTESNLIYDNVTYNVFGFNPFGTERFGSNPDKSGKKRFRLYLVGFNMNPFYNLQLEFASEGENQAWEILNYGFLIQKSSQPEQRSLYKQFK